MSINQSLNISNERSIQNLKLQLQVYIYLYRMIKKNDVRKCNNTCVINSTTVLKSYNTEIRKMRVTYFNNGR